MYTSNMDNETKWHTQLSKGLLEVAIMTLLNKKRMYGYEITKQIQSSGTLAISNGSIYPILKRLEVQGWITSHQEEHEGRLRKYYNLTKAGIIQLDARLAYVDELNQLLDQLRKGE